MSKISATLYGQIKKEAEEEKHVDNNTKRTKNDKQR